MSGSSCYIPYFPVEIVENILLYVDGLTLARAERVCTTWRAIAQGFKKKPNVWKRICKTEMNIEDILEIASHLYPAARMKQVWNDTRIDWHVIYRTSKIWKLVDQSTLEPRTIYETKKSEHKIICAKLTGSCVITGHDNGAVNIWSQDGVFLDQLTMHQLAVTDISLLSFFHELESIWDIDHEYVISTSMDQSIQISPILPSWMMTADNKIILRDHTCTTVMVRVHGDDFMVVSEDSHVSLWTMTAPTEMFAAPKVKLLAHIQLRGNGMLGMSFCAYRQPEKTTRLAATGISDEGRLTTICLNPVDVESDLGIFWTQHVGRHPQLLTLEGNESVNKTFLLYAKGYVWREQIFIWITGHKTLCLSIDGENYKEFNTMPYLHGVPTSAIVFQNLLILGLDSGAVILYYFSTAEDLMDIKWSNFSSRFQMGCQPIHYLALSVSAKSTMLLAASLGSMHIVSI